jgi:SEC-C motif
LKQLGLQIYQGTCGESMIKKTIYVLNIGKYEPDVTAITYPLIKKYANKIGAEFYEITERKFPDAPITYEKFQLYQLGREHKNDWNIFMDADILVHPDAPDITEELDRNKICVPGTYEASRRFKTDEYFKNYGNNLAVESWFCIASDLCIDLWHPFEDITIDEGIKNIFPYVIPRINFRREAAIFIDDYLMSRNIAKYELKYCLIDDVIPELKNPTAAGSYFFHTAFVNNYFKVRFMRELLKEGMAPNGDYVPKWKIYKEYPEIDINYYRYRARQKTARNDSCPCGSGKKYKKCCGA